MNTEDDKSDLSFASSSNKDLAHQLQSVIDTAIDGIITIDGKGHMLLVNPAARKMFGYKEEELLGKNVSLLMPEPHTSQHDDYIERYKTTGEKHIIGIGREVYGLRKDGTTFPFRLAVSEIKGMGERMFTGIIHDLTDVREAQDRILKMNAELESKVEERTNELEVVVNRLLKLNDTLRKKERELQQALQKEKELNDLKSRFVSTASHEFRTPLSTILSSASLIEKYPREDQQDRRTRHIDRIKSNVANLNAILNDFLSLSRLEEGNVAPVMKTINIPSFLEDLKEEVETLQDQQEFSVFIEEQAREMISDPQILKNILLNMLSNAFKYTPGDGKVFLSWYEKEDWQVIVVEDEGIGIPKSDQKYLFDRFFRASNAINFQGTGLGLNIVGEYVRQLGGRIHFESAENEGTIFTLELPKNETGKS